MAAPLSGQILRASDLGFTTFTPTWSNLTAGSGASNEGWYEVVGNMIHWGFRLEFGTSPSYSSSILMNLPVTAYAGGGTGLAGHVGAWGARSSGTINYAGSIVVNDSGGLQAAFKGAWSGSVPSSNIGVSSSTPFTPASGNVLSGSGSYRAA